MAYNLNLPSICLRGPQKPGRHPHGDNRNERRLRSMVPNQLHALHIGANSDRVLGERTQIQIPSATLLPAFYQMQKPIRRLLLW
jgi:hypothetical protein